MRFGATNNKKHLGEKMSELDVFGFIGTNRSIFSTFFLSWRLDAIVRGGGRLSVQKLLDCRSWRRNGFCFDWGGDARLLHDGGAELLFHAAFHVERNGRPRVLK